MRERVIPVDVVNFRDCDRGVLGSACVCACVCVSARALVCVDKTPLQYHFIHIPTHQHTNTHTSTKPHSFVQERIRGEIRRVGDKHRERAQVSACVVLHAFYMLVMGWSVDP